MVCRKARKLSSSSWYVILVAALLFLPRSKSNCHNLAVQIFENQLDTVLVCAGNGAQMSVNGATDYFWQPPGIFSDPNISNPLADPDSSMWVMVTGTLGLCTDVDSIYLNLIDPEINIIPEGDLLTICANDSIVCNRSEQRKQCQLNMVFVLHCDSRPVQSGANYLSAAFFPICSAYGSS